MSPPTVVERRLTAQEISSLLPYVPAVDLASAMLIIGKVPWYLPRRYAAIVRGCRVFIRASADAQDSQAWLSLLGHELTHVRQYREGMTAFTYLLSAVLGYRRSRYERESFAVQACIERDFELQRGEAGHGLG